MSYKFLRMRIKVLKKILDDATNKMGLWMHHPYI